MSLTKVTYSMIAGAAVNVEDFGATGDGVTNDTVAVQAALDSLPASGGTITFDPNGVYRLECGTADPYGLAPNSVAVLIQNKQNITIQGNGAKIIQTTSLSNVGVFVFDTSTDCVVQGINYTGAFTLPSSASAPLVGIIGASSRIKVSANANSGHSLCMLRSSDGTSAGTKPSNIIISGIINGSRYGVSVAHADNIHVDIIAISVTRCLFLFPARNVTGSVIGSDASASGVTIASGNSANCERIVLDIALDQCAASLAISAADDGTATEIKNIKISGSIKTTTTSTGVDIQTVSAGGTIYSDIDLSGLTIEGRSNTPSMLLQPSNAAGTFTNILLPSIRNTGSVEAFRLDNTIGATVSGVKKFGGEISNTSAGAAAFCTRIYGGTVSDIRFDGVAFTNNKSSTTAVSVETGSGVVIANCKSNKEIVVTGSSNIEPNCLNDHLVDGLFTGFTYSGTLGSGFSVSFRNLFICTSGSPSITAISKGITGQTINVVCDGGTPTFVDGTDLLLNGNFVGTAGDVLTLVCLDGTRWAEVARSAN